MMFRSANIMASRYVLASGETEISKKSCNGSPGKFSIWWTLLTVGLQRKELHQGWLVFTNQRVIFCKRHWLKQDLLGIFQAFFPSKRILWEVNTVDIESITPRQCLLIYPVHRIRTKRKDGEYYDFGYGNESMKELCKLTHLNYLES